MSEDIDLKDFFDNVNLSMEEKETIFVGIPSYRDNELNKTLDSLINNAEDFSRLSIVVFCQGKEEIVEAKYKDHSNIIFISTNTSNAKGTGWARNKIQSFYNNETYTLWVDAHMRFTKLWDSTLINMYKKLKRESYDPIITNYASQYLKGEDMHLYDPMQRELQLTNGTLIENNGDYIVTRGSYVQVDNICNGDGKRILGHIDESEKWNTQLVEFLPSCWVSLHFLFTEGEFNNKIKFDPCHYFSGDEYNITLRSYTHGYDIVSPTKIVMSHWYKRDDVINRPQTWAEYDPDWTSKDEFGILKNMDLFDGKKDDEYGLGEERTIDDYIKYAQGVSSCGYKKFSSVSELKIWFNKPGNWDVVEGLISE